MTPEQYADYGLRTLKQLKLELEHSPDGNQFKKYPFQLNWINVEIKRASQLQQV
jgi:hypothetical protein